MSLGLHWTAYNLDLILIKLRDNPIEPLYCLSRVSNHKRLLVIQLLTYTTSMVQYNHINI